MRMIAIILNRIYRLLLAAAVLLLPAAGCDSVDPVAEEVPSEEVPSEEVTPPEDPPAETEEFETAAEAVLHMGAGWNLGNTLDSNSGDRDNMWIEAWTARAPKDYETAWGQPQTTRALIHMFREAGFGAIRVPVTWYPHMGTITLHDTNHWNPASWTGTAVDPEWMARVQEVVDYVLDEGLYCILNVHHDTGSANTAWLIAGESEFEKAKARYQSLWQQIAETFKDYDEKLLFESYNEMLDPYGSWCFASFATPAGYDAAVAKAAYTSIYNYGRQFTETVRATGGKNACRNLIVNTYAACSGDGTWNTHLQDPVVSFTLPENPGHIAVEVHSYWDAGKFDAQKDEIDALFSRMDSQIIKRLGVPVVIGEWGGGSNEDSEANVRFASYFSKKASDAGIAAFWWMGLSDGEDRAVPRWTMPNVKDAILLAY